MNGDAERIKAILADVKPLAAEYYRLTGKPLGVTGEVAEYVAAEILGLELVPPRTGGYDAIRRTVPISNTSRVLSTASAWPGNGSGPWPSRAIRLGALP